jgi:hypothetical protein
MNKNILLLSVCSNWLYNLFRDYVYGIQLFIKTHMSDVKCEIIFCQNIVINTINFDEYTTILFFGNMDVFRILTKYNIYYVNIEQISIPSYRNLLCTLDTKTKVVDYSEENIYNYDNYFSCTGLIPPYFESSNVNKSINVLSIINNGHRTNIINNISNIDCLKIDNCFGITRDTLFKNTKIYVNIHASEKHKTMELIRIVNLILNRVIVISQSSVNIDLLFLKKYIIICDTLQLMEEKIKDILNDYTNFHSVFFADFDTIDYPKYIDYIKSNIQQII